MRPRGNCYVTSEALYHLLGGKEAGWMPCTVRHEGTVHWYLVNTRMEGPFGYFVLDATASQFKTRPLYFLGRGRGFMTRGPSRRARELMGRMVWQDRVESPTVRTRNRRKNHTVGTKAKRSIPKNIYNLKNIIEIEGPI